MRPHIVPLIQLPKLKDRRIFHLSCNPSWSRGEDDPKQDGSMLLGGPINEDNYGFDLTIPSHRDYLCREIVRRFLGDDAADSVFVCMKAFADEDMPGEIGWDIAPIFEGGPRKTWERHGDEADLIPMLADIAREVLG